MRLNLLLLAGRATLGRRKQRGDDKLTSEHTQLLVSPRSTAGGGLLCSLEAAVIDFADRKSANWANANSPSGHLTERVVIGGGEEAGLDRVTRAKPRFATIKVRNAAAILPTLVELGVDPNAVLRSAGIEPAMFSDLDNDLPFTTLDRLVEACVKATGCESFGHRVGARMQPTAVGLTGLVSMHAATVRDALQVLSTTLKTSNTGVAVTLDVRGQIASFQYVVTAPNIGAADQIVDAAIAMIVNTIRRLCGPAWRPKRVRLSRDPPRDRTPFAEFYKVPIEFGALTAGVIFDAAALDWPVRDRDPDYAKILAPLLVEAVVNAEGDFVSAVKSVLRTRIGAGSLTRDSVCRALGLNARTLAHRLEAFGVTFSGLADEVRFDAAQNLLLRDRRVGEIAAELGFAEPSAFIRAFKSWSGTTPARWRAARNGRPL